jgi:hypothetical protein
MTFEELSQELPNGFHDAEIRGVSLDFLVPSIRLEVSLDVSDSDDPDPERYRNGTLQVVTPYLFFLEAPYPDYPFLLDGAPLDVSGDTVLTGQNSSVDKLIEALPPGATAYRFFLHEWNSFLYLAGAGVKFSWDDDS